MSTNKVASVEVSTGSQALLVIDVQQGLFEKATPIYQAERLLDNIQMLVERAHQAGMPVFYIQHSDERALVKGSAQWRLHARLHPQAEDEIIYKQHGNAFEDTVLAQALQARGVSSLVISGLVTHGCVRATCLGALKSGYAVTLVKDAHSSYSEKAAALIDEWNHKLSIQGAELVAAEINFLQTQA